ncbi:sterol desaturase family protein [Simiduia sp. 21SJ11W-1]|uniref:sterol desaturase family protein n=1 Tax=Simiduia sp. 21SJ11W-1 TaxID=2909669 RepID=UPI00209D908C|nr:sterol desaturase family protein [Simiduia sp. 21SJ11W-1]UTA47096.1 sterol desaturase family protein [Simiduia sp. 21SJ11W-1]
MAWLAIFTVDTLRYFAGVGVVLFVLFVLARRWSERRRIQQRRATGADVRREITWSLVTTAVFALVGLFTMRVEQSGYSLIYMEVAERGWVYTVLSVPLVLIVHDAYFYWVHRFMHHPKLFKRFHRLHHLSRTPTSWASYSFAPGEAVVMALFMPLVVVLMPLHVGVIFIFLAVMIVRNAMGHCGVEFHPHWWVDTPLDALTTPTHHDLHHQKFNGNYALYFTWWDRWMGTELPGYKAAFKRAAAGCERVPVVADKAAGPSLPGLETMPQREN